MADGAGTGIGMERRSGMIGDEELEGWVDCASEKDMVDFTRLGSASRLMLEVSSSALGGEDGEDPCTSPRPNPLDELRDSSRGGRTGAVSEESPANIEDDEGAGKCVSPGGDVVDII